MRNQSSWRKNILTWGLVFVGLGVGVALLGLVLPRLGISLPEGLILGASVMLLILGFVSLLQYAYVRANPRAGQQMQIKENDERLQWIRARAGQRAYGLSGSLAFAVLIYTTFAGDVGLPALSGNALFFSLLAVVVIPFLAYIGALVYEQNHS
ncbi:MAG TPA: hypothetical protein VMT46_16175 [Anaerolineaceae bacterium]|nr:hypothetical protein [Anaerolineaceae bacterium]